MNHPILALAIEILAIVGLTTVLGGAETWLRERFDLDCNPLRILPASGRLGPLSWKRLSFGIPRRFRVTRRWDRPGALVNLADGRYGRILAVCTHPDTPGAVAAVQPESNDPDEDGTPLWVAWESLTPVPSGAPAMAQDGGLA